MVDIDKFELATRIKLLNFVIALPKKPDVSLLESISVKTTKVTDIMQAFLVARGPMFGEPCVYLSYKVLSIIFLLEMNRCSTKTEPVFSHESSGDPHRLSEKELYFAGYLDIKNRMSRFVDFMRPETLAIEACIEEILATSEITPTKTPGSSYQRCCQALSCNTCARQVHKLTLADSSLIQNLDSSESVDPTHE
jgi:hypothetical protein